MGDSMRIVVEGPGGASESPAPVSVGDPGECGVGAAVAVFGGKWKPFVIWVLAQGPRRFLETRRLVTGISEKVLTQQLRELEADGIVHRRAYDELPPRVEYSLTPKGRRLNDLLQLLADWGGDHLAERAMPSSSAGSEAGMDASGMDASGTDASGMDASGTDASGTDRSGPSACRASTSIGAGGPLINHAL
ncbi:winged helix-turn-helix transcriptional regulator [Streptomyces sp. NPDC051561]|uniref:winged helix-turn-helix transcriptional regulator n=1 Tax=Streptomyces sp. NPDC051561 TaxID=3365658 RepID=UPI0037A80B06